MGLNEVDDYFRKDTELQNYTKTGVKRIINSFIFQNNFKFLPVHFLYFEKNVLRVSFEKPPQIKQKYTLMSRLMFFLLTVTWGTASKYPECMFFPKMQKCRGENWKLF